MTGAQALIESLKREQVAHIFGYAGATICPAVDALKSHPEIGYTLVRTEQNAGHMASGYARISGKVGVCMVTSGPGATNLITGIATAYMDSIPMVAITGQVPSNLLGRDIFQEVDITGAVAPFSKHSYLVKDANDIPRIVKEAFHIASTGRPGPVLIDIPIDVQEQSLKKFYYPEEVSIRGYKPSVKGNDLQIKRVVEAISRSKQPLICAGGGVWLADAKEELLELAEKHGRTLLRIDRKTVDATSEIIDYLNKKLAPQITRHGVLMNINGQGVLLLGDSGIGKSETAIELLKRGHRLVADDAVDIRRISTSLYGTAPELIRHYIEIRGVGVIDVQQLFGMGAVQFDTEIDLVVQLEQWQDGKFYDRLGLGEETYEILGVKLPYMTVPVRPGRNLAGIVEIATMKNRQMKYGYNPARDFVTRLDQHYDALNEANRRKSK